MTASLQVAVTRSLSLLLAVLLFIACGSPRATPAPTPTAAPTQNPGYITSAEYGAAWPFTAPAGTLLCDRDDARLLVRFTTGDGIEYALNGAARSFGFPELDTSIMPAWPDSSGLGDLIARGLELCR